MLALAWWGQGGHNFPLPNLVLPVPGTSVVVPASLCFFY